MAIDMFLVPYDQNGTQIKGESQVTGLVNPFTNQTVSNPIELMSFDKDISNTATYSSSGTTSGKAQFAPLTITKSVDVTSEAFENALYHGYGWRTVYILLRKASGDGAGAVYFGWNLGLVLVTDIDVTMNDGDEQPTETVQLVYGRVATLYRVQDPDTGALGTPTQSSWSQITNKPVPPTG